jgi:hypothetical protein
VKQLTYQNPSTSEGIWAAGFSSNSSTQIAMFVRNFAGDVDTSSLCISGAPVRAQGKLSFNILDHLDLETIQKSIAESGVSASKVTRGRR